MSMHRPLHNHHKTLIDHTSYTEAVAESIEYKCVMMAGLKFPGPILTAAVTFLDSHCYQEIWKHLSISGDFTKLSQ